MMDDIIIVENEDSENSVVEVEVPRRPTPPLIHIEDEEIILNIMERNHGKIMAKDFIETDKALSATPGITANSHFTGPNHWTTDMIKFYNDDWGDEEHFIVEKIQEKMDKTPSLWEVSRRDTLSMNNKKRKSNVRCWNCNQFGHHFSVCPDPPHVPKCHMCGLEGHVEYGCPNSKCLNCGNYSKKYVTCCYKCRHQQNEMCSRCRTIGHNFINCPDHWRLFHLTTGTTSVKIPDKDIYKPSKEIWCCNCGKKGHYHINCRQRKDCSAFTDTLQFVVSYHKAFKDNVNTDKPTDTHKKRRRSRKKQKDKKVEKILHLNPMHKAINKDNSILKKSKQVISRIKNLKKVKKNKKRKKESPFNLALSF